MQVNKLVTMAGFCAISLFSSSAMAQLWVKNCATNQCLDATTDAPNGRVQVSDCDTSKKAQQWYATSGIVPSPIQNAYEGFDKPCLDMSEAAVGGFQAITNSCDKTKQAQNWYFAKNGHEGPIENGYFSGQCLTVADDGTVTPAGCNGERLQRWLWVNVGDETICPQTATGEGKMKLPKPTMKLPKVKPVAPGIARTICSFDPPGDCTRDKNKCGHPSACECPLAYSYNPATGKCDYAFEQAQTGSAKNSTGGCDCSFPAEGSCTSDLNECGQSSNCDCGINPAYVYNPATGNCDLELR